MDWELKTEQSNVTTTEKEVLRVKSRAWKAETIPFGCRATSSFLCQYLQRAWPTKKKINTLGMQGVDTYRGKSNILLEKP